MDPRDFETKHQLKARYIDIEMKQIAYRSVAFRVS
jgi:hypothetical protein